MTQTISVSCKLQVPVELRQEIDRTLQGFADACNQILEVAKHENCRNATKLHHLTYYRVKLTTGLKANHVCQAIRRVVGNLKAVKQVHKFRPTSISLDARVFTYRESDQHVGITLMSKRVWLPCKIGNYQLALLRGQIPTSATLVKRRSGDYYIQVAVELDTPPTGKTPKVIGVDLGRRDIATTSTHKAWNGSQLQATRDRYSLCRASLQSKRTRGSKRLLKRLSGKEARFQKNINHSISRQLVNEAKTIGATLAFEDLSDIRKSLNTQPRNKTERRRTNNWAFYQLRMFVTYKAVLAGVPVVFVPPAYTSQTCSRCHHVHPEQGRSYRNGKVFKCGHCGLETDADSNAANNIATLGAVVNQPESSVMSCVLEGQLSLLCSTFNQG
ncbi:IS200/IS605 family element transposase accessory protein TnpB [Desertifilum sp. FACHB-1129]|uniref:RNA-guided endonuclease InsQ/TnpB family protein n=1 Tax=unclassified Desertifilum TaxID=2621682 RepID=UPI001684A985|nr:MULTISPECIES: RNA-guided endonuclease TnpB family protein [unclassified Desertifilum]MBD2311076.1 IS200/IS605 family element transposase accessory protein TnpB [Desertifilum sp. FACHB-1129]MBD2323943.1 IS200/IS605 family element transposase accessory protein TnpB [Desertifilum sp. FACHB-866]MBD2333878.1 IS200/IS605 family element transposase accessory protein TnpB [Desertifilum sp. FACHB-868]MDA0211188.1 transposase [Cyanobacteria bacterium FC1]